MAEVTKLFYPVNNTDKFVVANRLVRIQGRMDEYNRLIKEANPDMIAVRTEVYQMMSFTQDEDGPREFSMSMRILGLALKKREFNGGEWLEGAEIAYNSGEIEICRELLYDSVEELGAKTVKDYNDDFKKILKENKNQNIADILGMITDELESDGLEEEDYERLLKDFAGVLEKWRNLEVPKIFEKGSYEIIHEIMEKCYRHKAYHTAVKLAGLLFVADRTKKYEYLSTSMCLVGKILYELGHLEAAKRCFIFAEEDSKGQCWQAGDEKYKTLLEQETKLEPSKEIIEAQRQLDEKVASGKINLYTWEELKEYRKGKLEIPVISEEQLKKERKDLGNKAVKRYEKSAKGTPEERLKAIEEAFGIFMETPEVYPEATELYLMKAKLYLDKGESETAYDCLKKAYCCTTGKRNGMVLLGKAVILSRMGRIKEASACLFRTYILYGKDFIIDKAGGDLWKLIEQYL